MERLHITAFGVQELVLSALYIWGAAEFLRTSLRPHSRRIVLELITINVILSIIDVAGITLEYCNLFFFDVAFKMASYSIKLKLEFAILSKLMALSSGDEKARERDSRGDTLVFQTDTTSTAVDKGMHPSTNTTLTFQTPSVQAEPGGTTVLRHHRNASISSEKPSSEHSEDIESYGDVIRRMSRPY